MKTPGEIVEAMGRDTKIERSFTPLPNPEYARAKEVRRRNLLIFVSLLTNLIGALIVAALLVLVIPLPELEDENRGAAIALLSGVGGVYFLASSVLGNWFMSSRLLKARQWAKDGRVPSEREVKALLRGPVFLFFAQSSLWVGGAFVLGAFAFQDSNGSWDTATRVGITVGLAGITTCGLGYLLSERVLRPLAAIALEVQPLRKPALPGVTARSFLVWLLSSGVGFLGLILISVSTLVDQDFTRTQVAIAVLGVCGAATFGGILGSIMAGRSISAPIISLRRAISEVEKGNLDAEVEVYDGSEIGLLQGGFNRMVSGLRDRERIRDIFGRQVGEDVARAALSGELEMGGETRDVAILFIDMVGSTRIAEDRQPTEVVELLNRFFGVVVEVIDEYGGWVNKFEGDAALAVFGAPTPIDDKEGCCLAAARELARRLDGEVEGCKAGIGLASGQVVAGNIGDPSRYEYTVIGDPVNTAARLTEMAKLRPGGVIATRNMVKAARPKEAANWEDAGEETLRGRSKPTRLAVPRGSEESGNPSPAEVESASRAETT